MSLPLVTAVVLSYNTGEWAINTIRSILDNGYENIEIICIDDASNDGSSQRLLKDFKINSNFGKLIFNIQNKGIPASANQGLALANGKYFFVIGDDCILPGKIEEDVKILELSSEKTALVHSIMQFTNFDFTIKYPHFSPTFPFPIKAPDNSTIGKIIASGGGVAAPTAVFKTKALLDVKGWDESLKYEDKPMWLKLASTGFKFEFRPEVTVLYRRNSSQVSNFFKDGDLIYQMRVFGPYSKFPETKSQMKKILIYASSSKIDGIPDLSECIQIYRNTYSRFSPFAFLASTGILTFLARLFRLLSKSKKD